MALLAVVDYRRLREVLPLLYVGTLALLGAVLVAGVTVNGAKSWFAFGGFQLQPSEPGKIIVILALGFWFGADASPPGLRRLAIGLAIAGVPIALILLEPDLGTVLVYGMVVAAVIVAAGTRAKYLAAILLLLVVGTVGALQSNVLKQYQVDRLTVFLEDKPTGEVARNAAYNLEQAKVAIGNGGLTGMGLFEGTQARGKLVPEQQTDFIFTVVGEELGFVGSVGLLLLYAFMIWRIWRIAALAPDFAGTLICIGVLAMLLFQMFESIGMTTGMMPITGIPLPFFSYGGSSILTSFAAIGLVLSVHRRRLI